MTPTSATQPPQSPTPRHSAGPGFAGLQPAALAAWLQRAALHLIEDLAQLHTSAFDEGTKVAIEAAADRRPGPPVSPPTANALLSPSDMALLRLGLTSPDSFVSYFERFRPVRAWRKRRHLRAIHAGLAGRIDQATWEARFLESMRLHQSGSPELGCPDELWPMLGYLAWTEPTFCRRFGLLVQRRLLHDGLFLDGLPPLPSFHPNTFWLLLHLVGTRPRGWRDVLQPSRRRKRRVLRAIQRRTRHLIVQTQWAGWWDQWLLVEILSRHPRMVEALPSAFRAALHALPYLEQRGLNQPPPKRRVHRFLARLIPRPMAKRPQQPRHRPTFSLATPNWQSQRPSRWRECSLDSRPTPGGAAHV